MTEMVLTNAFASGDGVAVLLPSDFGVKPGDALEIRCNGRVIEIATPTKPGEEQARLAELVRRLRELGPVKTPQPREPIEFPDRPGLY